MKDYIKETSKSDAKPLSKEELIARLKAIANDETPREVSNGAMCYCPRSLYEEEKHIKCDICGSDTVYTVYFTGDRHKSILAQVKRIADLGYDVKVESICESCAEKLKNELYPNSKSCGDEGFDWEKDICLCGVNHVFYFRSSDEEEYHRAIADNIYKYEALLTLLENKPMYYDNYDNNYYIADEIDTLEFMTGIKFDI